MNKGQAEYLQKIVRKQLSKRCGVCLKKRVFAIVSITSDGRTSYHVTVNCDCQSLKFHDFGR